MKPIPHIYLPLPAKCALEVLDSQNTSDRSIVLLDKYLDHYFKVYAMACDSYVRQTCHDIATRRYDFNSQQKSGFQPLQPAH